MDINIGNISSAPYLCTEEGLGLIRETTAAVNVALQKINNLKQYVKHQMALKSIDAVSKKSGFGKHGLHSEFRQKNKKVVNGPTIENLPNNSVHKESATSVSINGGSFSKIQGRYKPPSENVKESYSSRESNNMRDKSGSLFPLGKESENPSQSEQYPLTLWENGVSSTPDHSDLNSSIKSLHESPLQNARVTVKPMESLLNSVPDEGFSNKYLRNWPENHLGREFSPNQSTRQLIEDEPHSEFIEGNIKIEDVGSVDSVLNNKGESMNAESIQTHDSLLNFRERNMSPLDSAIQRQPRESLINISDETDSNNKVRYRPENPLNNTVCYLPSRRGMVCNMPNNSDFNYSFRSTSKSPMENLGQNLNQSSLDTYRQNMIGNNPDRSSNVGTPVENMNNRSIMEEQFRSNYQNHNTSIKWNKTENNILGHSTSLEKQSGRASASSQETNVDRLQVYFIIEHNSVSGRDISEVFMKEGFNEFSVAVKNEEFYTSGSIEFSNEEAAQRAASLSSKIFIFGRKLTILPFQKVSQNNLSCNIENLAFPIEENMLINISCGYERNRLVSSCSESFNPVLGEADVNQDMKSCYSERQCSSRDSSYTNSRDSHNTNNFSNNRRLSSSTSCSSIWHNNKSAKSNHPSFTRQKKFNHQNKFKKSENKFNKTKGNWNNKKHGFNNCKASNKNVKKINKKNKQ